MGLTGAGLPAQPNVQENVVLPPIDHRTQLWHTAYMEALFENDRNKMRGRIVHARHLILRREQGLCAGNSDPQELSALNRALHALQALRTCLGL